MSGFVHHCSLTLRSSERQTEFVSGEGPLSKEHPNGPADGHQQGRPAPSTKSNKSERIHCQNNDPNAVVSYSVKRWLLERQGQEEPWKPVFSFT